MDRKEKIEYIEKIERQYCAYLGYFGALKDLDEKKLDDVFAEYKYFEQCESNSNS